MEIKQIKELMATMGRTGTKKLTLKKEGFELELERDSNSIIRNEATLEYFEEPLSYHLGSSPRANAALLKGKETSASIVPSSETLTQQHEGSLYITSPMVGTFYPAAGPDEPLFVKVGDKVDKNTVVCIIEAMKVMNEVKAGISGTVVEVLVDNGSPVEFGTKLFRIS